MTETEQPAQENDNRYARSPAVRGAIRFWRWAKPWSVSALRVGAVWTVAMTGLIIYDFAAAGKVDEAVVTGRSSYRGSKSGMVYYLHARGRKDYREAVSRTIWDRAEVGDHLRLRLSPVFGEWTEATLLRDGHDVETFSGLDPLFMVIFSFLFLVPLIAFRDRKKVEENVILVIGCAFVTLLATAFWIVVITGSA